MSNTNITLKISGMTSPSCILTISNLIVDERGVEKIKVSYKNSSVTITGSEKLNKVQIINSINLSGKYHAE